MTWIFDPKRPALMPERRGAWFGRKSLDGPSKLRTSAPQKEPGNIAKAKNEEQRAAVAIMVAVRNFCTATANSSGDNNET